MSKGGQSGAGILAVSSGRTISNPGGLNPIGGGANDSTAINNAIAAASAGQIVQLNAGNFSVNGGSVILVNKAITLRGAGAGKTIITKTDGTTPQVGFTASIAATVMTVTSVIPTIAFTGSVAGSVLTVTGAVSGAITAGVFIAGAGISAGVTIASFGTGTGAAGTYNLSTSVGTIGSEAMTGTYPLTVGASVGGTGVPGGTVISSFGTGAGNTGTYNLNTSSTVASEGMFSGTQNGPHSAQIIIVGPQQFNINPGNPTNLTQDAVAGARSITVASTTGFLVGQIVLLDELSGAKWMPDTLGGNAAAGYQVWAAPDYRVTYKKHWPTIQFVDDFGGGNLTASISGTVLNVTAVTGGGVGVGAVLSGAGIPTPGLGNDVVIQAYGTGGTTGVGGTGTYALNQNLGTIGSESMLSSDYPYLGSNFGDTFSRLDRVTCEIKEIASIVGNVITFTSPISISYRVSHTAQLSFYSNTVPAYVPHLQNAGVESLTLQGGDSGNLSFQWTAYCWAKDVESFQWLGLGVEVLSSFRTEIRRLYSHDATFPRPGSGAYAICLDTGSSEVLVEDCISIMTNKVVVARAAGAGSVFAYNYTDMGMIDFQETWIEVGINGSHFCGPHHMLFEGNYAVNADSDDTHGASIYHLFFRNWLRASRHTFVDPNNGDTVNDIASPGNGPRRCAGLQDYSYWMSFVGNVLGGSGEMSGFAYEIANISQGAGVWLLGWDNDFTTTPSSDPVVKSNIIRDGNWDWLNSAQKWENTPGKFTVPGSLYLSGAPAFFGANTWPWVDPSTGTTLTLPAKARWESGNPNGP